jgi:hypothetical protein
MTSESVGDVTVTGDDEGLYGALGVTALMDKRGSSINVSPKEWKEESDARRVCQSETSSWCELETLDVDSRERALMEPLSRRLTFDHWPSKGDAEAIVSMVARRDTGERVWRGGAGKPNEDDSEESTDELRE